MSKQTQANNVAKMFQYAMDNELQGVKYADSEEREKVETKIMGIAISLNAINLRNKNENELTRYRSGVIKRFAKTVRQVIDSGLFV